MTRPWVLMLIVCAFWTGWASGADPEGQRLHLKNGDRITGTSDGEKDGKLQWRSMFGEVLEVPSDQVDRIELPEEAKPAVVPEPPAPAAVPPPVVAPTPEQLAAAQEEIRAIEQQIEELEHPYSCRVVGRKTWEAINKPLYDWTKRFTLGARYLTGNSEETMVNLQADLERNYEAATVQVQAGGQFGKSNGVRGTNRWFANSTTDFHAGDRWIWFIKHTDEYDEFQNLDYRATLTSGLGYRFLKEEKKQLIARIGPSGTYEIFRDPPNTRTSFDLFGELEGRWPLAKRVQFEHKATVYPTVEDFEMVRVNATANLMIALDERDCWHLQLGVQDQYQSQPNPGRVPHDLWTNLSIVYQRK